MWTMTLDFYKDAADEWRWRLTHRNGRIVGASTESYHNYQDCVSNAKLVTQYFSRGAIRAGTNYPA